MTFGGKPTRFEPDGPARGVAVVLPGRAYPPSAPLLDLARRALVQHGFAVQEVWWDATSRSEPEVADPEPWVRRQVEAALAGVDGEQVLLVGKSLGCSAAAYAAEHGLDAVWLTPVLVDPGVARPIRANPAHQLMIGGSADPYWDGSVARQVAESGCQVLELLGADHGLCTDDVVGTAELHVEVARAITSFLGRD